MNPLGWTGEDKNMKAFNSKEEYIEWFCFHPSVPEPYRDDGFYVRELTMLSEYIHPSVVVELGTSVGMGTILLSNLNPEAKLYSVDIADTTFIPGNKIVPIGYLSKMNGIDCEYVHGKSYEFEPEEEVDFCFIDGDHLEEGVWKDSLWSWKHKSDDFVIVWHDFRIGHPEFQGLIRSITRFSAYVGKDVYKLKDSSTVWMI